MLFNCFLPIADEEDEGLFYIKVLSESLLISLKNSRKPRSFCKSRLIKKKTIIGEEQVIKANSTSSNRDTSKLSSSLSLLKHSIEGFCTKDKEIRGQWVILSDAAGRENVTIRLTN
jgi:hypothetical protein